MSTELRDELHELRRALDDVFADDTRAPGAGSDPPSSGHCAAVALIVQGLFGGDLLSTRVWTMDHPAGVSHWYNRVKAPCRGCPPSSSMPPDGHPVEVDLTGDQFGGARVMLSRDALYLYSKVRGLSEVNDETRARSELLRSRLPERWRGDTRPTRESP